MGGRITCGNILQACCPIKISSERLKIDRQSGRLNEDMDDTKKMKAIPLRGLRHLA